MSVSTISLLSDDIVHLRRRRFISSGLTKFYLRDPNLFDGRCKVVSLLFDVCFLN